MFPLNGSVSPVSPLDDEQWDKRLADFPGATFFHGRAWARVLNEAYQFQPMYLVGGNPDGSRSLLPLMEVDSWLTGRRAISLPFTDECPPLCRDEAGCANLIDAAMACAASRRWRYVELRGGRSLVRRAPASTRYYGHVLDLRERGSLFSRCESATRRAVRKAAASPLAIHYSRSLDSLRAFHGLLCQTRRRHGVPPQPFRFFESIQHHILDSRQGLIVLATLDGLPVAGALFFHFGAGALYKYAASDEAFQHLRPNNLVLWRAIEWHASAGFTSLDLGRTSVTNDGLRHFKLGWGARERLIEYVRYNRHTHDFVTARDPANGWQRDFLKTLPPSLLRLIGAAAYRHVA